MVGGAGVQAHEAHQQAVAVEKRQQRQVEFAAAEARGEVDAAELAGERVDRVGGGVPGLSDAGGEVAIEVLAAVLVPVVFVNKGVVDAVEHRVGGLDDVGDHGVVGEHDGLGAAGSSGGEAVDGGGGLWVDVDIVEQCARLGQLVLADLENLGDGGVVGLFEDEDLGDGREVLEAVFALHGSFAGSLLCCLVGGGSGDDGGGLDHADLVCDFGGLVSGVEEGDAGAGHHDTKCAGEVVVLVGSADTDDVAPAVLATGLGGARDERRGKVGGIFAHVDERERLGIGATGDLRLGGEEKRHVDALLACRDIDGLEEELGQSIGGGGEVVGRLDDHGAVFNVELALVVGCSEAEGLKGGCEDGAVQEERRQRWRASLVHGWEDTSSEAVKVVGDVKRRSAEGVQHGVRYILAARTTGRLGIQAEAR
ncbi:hypothetical protein L1887_59806 [Cichorium endivia]|nr:hypothetical protein L1887_59806 [Cichorium endivia]